MHAFTAGVDGIKTGRGSAFLCAQNCFYLLLVRVVVAACPPVFPLSLSIPHIIIFPNCLIKSADGIFCRGLTVERDELLAGVDEMERVGRIAEETRFDVRCRTDETEVGNSFVMEEWMKCAHADDLHGDWAISGPSEAGLLFRSTLTELLLRLWKMTEGTMCSYAMAFTLTCIRAGLMGL